MSRSSEIDSSPGSTTPRELRSQIEHTRAEISETIDAIQTRLSPAQLVSDAKSALKEQTVGRAKRLLPRSTHGQIVSASTEHGTLLDAIKRNPMPVALIGVAAILLVARAWTRDYEIRIVRR
jgi:hypothetical protein